ncbi:MAG: TonB-dependent receptor [Nitrospirae bacterium]|jgi:outer membrane cobalamin receptor|nr:TonB-dependent receptor [Nitrospirota bacterium]
MKENYHSSVMSRQFLKIIIFVLLVFTSYFTFVISVFGEEKNISLEEIVVTATKIEEPLYDIPNDITVITKKQIENGSYTNISEILKNVTGLHLFEYGNKGSSASISLRASTSAQVLVLIDGKRLNKPGDGQVDINALSIPIENIERIEILRGASSALYGADAMGGVINIITRIPEQAKTSFSASYGRFVTKELNFNTSQRINKAGFYLSLSKNTSAGFRENSEYDSESASIKIAYDISKDIRADISFDYNFRDAGVPGSLSWLTPKANEKDKNFLAGINIKYKDSVMKIYSHNSTIDYMNPGLEDNIHKNHVLGFDLQHSMYIGSANLFTGGIEILEEDIDSTNNLNENDSIGRHSRTRKGIFLQNETFLKKYLILTLGLRYDSISSEDRFSPKASLLIKLPYQTNISFSAGQGFRVPEMNALYWPDTGWAEGNPDLKSEKSTEYEVNIQKFFGSFANIRAVGFLKQSKDLIQWQETSPFKWSPVNISKTRVIGFETESNLHFDLIDIGLSYTFMDPQDRNLDKKLRFSTRHQIKGNISLHPFRGNTISLEGSYVHRYKVEKGDPGCYFFLDGKIAQKLNIWKIPAEIFIVGKNIFDRNFETLKDYPMPPVQFSAGMSFSF